VNPGAKIDINHAIPDVHIREIRRRIIKNAGVVHERVDATELGPDARTHAGPKAWIRHVALNSQDTASCLLTDIDDTSQRGRIPAAQSQPRSSAREPQRNCSADASRGSGDDNG
jgi:hypothetical protein